MKYFTPIVAVAGLTLLAVAQDQTPPPGHTFPPPFSFPVPDGATSWDFVMWDDDGWFNPDDRLDEQKGLPLAADAGGHVDVDLERLSCRYESVLGPLADAGEYVADVYVVVTFHFPGGGSTTLTSEVREVSCADLPESTWK